MVKITATGFLARLLLMSVLAGVCGLAIAAKPLALKPGMTGVPDLGAIKCEMFNRMYPNGPTGMSQAVLTWAQGYFYALTGNTIDEILAPLPEDGAWDFDRLTGHIVDYCEEHPESPLPEAVKGLWSALSTE